MVFLGKRCKCSVGDVFGTSCMLILSRVARTYFLSIGYPKSEATWVTTDNFASIDAFEDDIRALKKKSISRHGNGYAPERKKRKSGPGT